MSLQIYTPYVCDIDSISPQGATTLITTTIVHSFSIGNLVKFQIPKQYGMRQLNPLKAYVLDVPADNEILVVLDTSKFDPFVIPTPIPTVVLDPAQVIPAGDANSGYSAPGAVQPKYQTIPGSYQGIVN